MDLDVRGRDDLREDSHVSQWITGKMVVALTEWERWGTERFGGNQESHLVIVNLRCWRDTQMEVSGNSISTGVRPALRREVWAREIWEP